MAYLLLLALVFVAGIASILFFQEVKPLSPPRLIFAIGFTLLGVGLLAEIALGFTLDESAARLFYWARGSLVLAWFGQGMLTLLFPGLPATRWLNYGLILASIAMLVLVLAAQITGAQGWYSLSRPIYSQIGDLLATNRPTRWGALALNLYGLALLVSGPVYLSFFQSFHRTKAYWRAAVLTVISAISLFAQFYWPPTEASLYFYLAELITPISLFVGLRKLTSFGTQSGAERRTL